MSLFEKSAQPTGNQHTHIALPNNTVGHCVHLAKSDQEKFSSTFFKRWRGQGREALVALRRERNTLNRSKNAGEGEFLCEAKKEGEPSSGVLLYVLKIENWKLACEHCAPSHYNINHHSIAFSFDTISAKEKASQKENAVFLCRFLKKAPQKLFLIALCKMYKAPDRIVWSGYMCALIVRRSCLALLGTFSSTSSWAQSNSERSEEQTERSDVWDLGQKSSTPLRSAQDDG